MTSVVLIIPADSLAEANALGEQLGYGPNNYSVPLSADGSSITHWGCHIAVASDSFVELLYNPPAEAQAVVANLLISVSSISNHFSDALNQFALEII
jgi:hypothetical protein